ncbi:hypothetical protein [Erythrobacter aurantius]|uniref:hypothetical protein n=1 Tax=Erythrobacter aurantius TaxID=2909249 RepID=UPI0020796ED6|nr:hypothetical protein [Erythrobacter aurantius]
MASLSNLQIRLIHSLGDFQQTLSALAWISELEPDQKMTRIELRRYRCLEDAAVVAYWRPFSDSKGLPKLSLKKVGLVPNTAERSLHEELGVQRNKVVAHTDTDRMRFGFRVWKPFDESDLVMSSFRRDDSLALYSKLREWQDWTLKVHAAVARKVFDETQDTGEIDFISDYIRNNAKV